MADAKPRPRPRLFHVEAWDAATNEQRKRAIARWTDEGRDYHARDAAKRR